MAGTKYPLDDEPAAETPVTSRPRVGTRLWDKLDEISSKIDRALSSGGDGDEDGDEANGPTVTFEPEEELPVTASDEEVEEPVGEGAGTGEGTTNIAHQDTPRFRFPHRRRVEVPSEVVVK